MQDDASEQIETLIILPPEDEGGALALTLPEDKALLFFTKDGAIDPVLKKIREEIDRFKGDASTEKGRAAIKSFAMEVVRSKTYLDGVGKKLVDDYKDIPRKIDANRKRIRDQLDKWRDEIRAPVEAWEAEETRRINNHKATIEWLEIAGRASATSRAQELRDELAEVEALEVNPKICAEFTTQYESAKGDAIKRLREAIALVEKREADAAELAALRAEQEARKAREAEEAAKKEREAREARIAEEARQAEAQAAREREQRLKDEAEALERRAREAEEAAQREREESERRAAAAAEQARRDAEYAAQQKAEREAEEARRREENKRHRAKINNAAVAALVAGGVAKDDAVKAITLIAQRKVPAVEISY